MTEHKYHDEGRCEDCDVSGDRYSVDYWSPFMARHLHGYLCQDCADDRMSDAEPSE